MTAVRDDARMLRKQYHLSAEHVRRIETLRTSLGMGSDAEVIRRAIDTFEPDALDPTERALVAATAADLSHRVRLVNDRVDQTLHRARAAHEQLNDPAWIEQIRERTRREAENDPALVDGVARLMGA